MYSRRFVSINTLLGCAQYEFSECFSKVSMEHCQFVLQLCSRLLSYFMFHCFFWYVLARFRDFKTNTKLNNILFDSFEMYQQCVQHFLINTYVAIMTSYIIERHKNTYVYHSRKRSGSSFSTFVLSDRSCGGNSCVDICVALCVSFDQDERNQRFGW